MYQVKFQNDGFTMIKANNGEEGLQLADKEKPDFILLDVIMPKMDGFTVLKKLKENPNTKNIPVLLLTNLGQDEDVKKGNELGAVGYLVKANITPSEVVAKVKSLLPQ
jgi:DNA-binding response OmpR family regulator